MTIIIIRLEATRLQPNIDSLSNTHRMNDFWATVCKTVHPMLSNCCHVCHVCNVNVLWPNGWMDQDETCHEDRRRPRPHCVRRKPICPPQGAQPPQLSAHVCCGQTAGSIKILLSTEVGLVSGDIVLDGDPYPSQKEGTFPLLFGPCIVANGWMDQDATWYGGRPRPRPHCVGW